MAELRERLQEGPETTKAAVEAVIGRLREYGYLDDPRFAYGYGLSPRQCETNWPATTAI